MVKCRRNVSFEDMDPIDTERSAEKKSWFLITVRNIYGVYQKKYYYGSVKKSTFSFNCDLKIDKKLNNVNEDPRRKTDSNLDFFPSVAHCL